VLHMSESVWSYLLIFVVSLVCFSPSPTAFYIEAVVSFFSLGPRGVYVVGCVAGLLPNLRTLNFHPLAPLSSTSLGLH